MRYLKPVFLLFLIHLMLFSCSVAQPTVAPSGNFTTKKTSNKKAIAALEKGIAFYRTDKKENAIKEFEKSIAADANLIDAHIQLGSVYYDQKNFEKAEISFEKALKLSDSHEPKLAYTLGFVENLMDKYEEAALHFAQYLKKNPNPEMKILAEKALANCEFAAKAVKNPVPFTPISLGDKINTKDSEYLPSITLDEETLIYTKRTFGQEDLYMSKKLNNEWQVGMGLNNVNTELNEGGQNISANGKVLVYTGCNLPKGMGSCDLYFSEFRNGNWTQPMNIGAPINSAGWESQPSLSADGMTLYFGSNRGGGKGAMDIWKSQRQANGTWSNPENIMEVNTLENDISPFIHADNETLYLMSNGRAGMGGNDLYVSRKQANGKWGTPENLGYPINTKNDEGAIVVSRTGKTAYFASDRKYDRQNIGKSANGFSVNETDLYSFELPPNLQPKPVTYVKAKVRDKATKQPLKSNLLLLDVENNIQMLNVMTDSEGEFLICLPVGKNYSLNVSKAKYLFHSENFALQEAKNIEKPYILDIFLNPIVENPTTTSSTTTASKPEVVILKNVFFDTGSANLRQSSFPELNRLVQLLKDNPNMKIQINGHTDNVGSDASNQTLSQNRAKSVQDYLIQNGIATNRLSHKGFGKSQPIDTNDTDEGRQNNRRTEFQVVN